MKTSSYRPLVEIVSRNVTEKKKILLFSIVRNVGANISGVDRTDYSQHCPHVAACVRNCIRLTKINHHYKYKINYNNLFQSTTIINKGKTKVKTPTSGLALKIKTELDN